ncbi:MAG: hypothetical protein WC934_13780 [Acidithiobacillus sp.]|jgi:hypothetical protein|uniref:hypothetical protein n=1 Tax=Acidithiobacillus sp. TaxID=1872118 RepID=UPI00355D0FF7
MIIIVSGCDKVGKTTIMKRINKYTGIQVIKFKGPQNRELSVEEWANESLIFHNSILRYLEALNIDKNVVMLDRFYPDEIVYSSILRNKQLWNEYKHIDERFSKIGTKYIYVKPPLDFDEYKRRFDVEEDLTKWEEVNELLKSFDIFYDYTELDKTIITQDTPVKSIVDFICGRRKQYEKIGRIK